MKAQAEHPGASYWLGKISWEGLRGEQATGHSRIEWRW